MRKGLLGWLGVSIAAVAVAAAFAGAGSGSRLAANPDDPVYKPGTFHMRLDEESEERLLELDKAFVSRRTAGQNPLSIIRAGQLRGAAAVAMQKLRLNPPRTAAFSGSWSAIGPDPIVEVTRASQTLQSFQGRIGALAIRSSNGQIILGAAQGGIWLFDGVNWVPKTDFLPSLSTGALAIAPSNDSIVYAGTGEGALSGDSYAGFGVLKSTDGGNTWFRVSGAYFRAVSISRIVVDPTNATHLYAAVLRGRGGARRVTPPNHSQLGIWESTNGGATWNLKKGVASDSNGATDLEMDPQNPNVLYASFWGDAIYKSVNGGSTWSAIMNFGFTSPDFAGPQTRFALSLSHPSPGGFGVLYAGFDWSDAGGYHQSRVFKSTDGGATWAMLPDGSGGPLGNLDVVQDYCGGQCFYDNVIEADPTNPNIVFAAGQFGYGLSPQSGGIFRSDDGGMTWKNLGFDQHPDFHAFAFDPTFAGGVVVGSDGGVWYGLDYGGRPSTSDPLSAVEWISLNCCGLQIGQFTSIATNPNFTPRFWGGTQDNGTMRKSATSNTWFDLAGGDGGQVLVDPTDFHYVYGTYFGISPYRITDGGGSFFVNSSITGGINLGDRSDFYIPWVMNQLNPNQLFLGTYRLYRTDNAKAASAGAVLWKPISPDLTSGCTGTAPNGARTCALSAIGVGGGTQVYTGSLDGLVYASLDAQVNDNPTWRRIDTNLPPRPVSQFAVDRSNSRIAYVAYGGFNASTAIKGHVFKTTTGGLNWTNVSGNLPDVPVNSVVLDPSFPNTLYAGTDVGPFVTEDGGAHWVPLGTGFPIVAIWQLDLDPFHRTLAAGTHGRGAFTLTDANAVPALVLSKVDAGVPVGAGSNIDYAITLKNIGNADATGVTIKDPVPAGTSFVSADSGGSLVAGKVTWTGKTVPAVTDGTGGSITVHLTVRINNPLGPQRRIFNDGMTATSAEGSSTTGSRVFTPIAAPYAVQVVPFTQTDGAQVGSSVNYVVHVENRGSNTDSYTMSSTGGTFAVSFFQPDCTTPLGTTPTVAPGAATDVCVAVAVPGGAANGATSTATLKATSVVSPSVSGSATITTIAVAVDTLLVDDDGNIPDVQSIYTTALSSAGISYSIWDLGVDSNIPGSYMNAFKNIVWFTGNVYPGPILPYEARLQGFLDNGGRLFMSGQDILDQAAGTTDFVHDYLHIDWDGTENQNDKATANVASIGGAPSLTNGIGTVPIDHSVLGAAFEDQITPINGAFGIFQDDLPADDALQFAGSYKVVFLAFPFEAYGSAAQKANLMTRVFTFFGP